MQIIFGSSRKKGLRNGNDGKGDTLMHPTTRSFAGGK
jgi:hypothetical protein